MDTDVLVRALARAVKPSVLEARHDRTIMSVIIIEGVLFVALIATGAALLYFVVVQFTPVGVRLRQAQNRRRIDRAAELVCPLHGPRAEKDLVRLASGDVMCPDCYKEIVHG
jgi:hypothetical protein